MVKEINNLTNQNDFLKTKNEKLTQNKAQRLSNHVRQPLCDSSRQGPPSARVGAN